KVMMMDFKYGFSEEIIGGKTVGTIMTGDGFTQFCDVIYPDNPSVVGLAITYGEGDGTINNLTIHEQKRDLDSFDVGYVIKFCKPESIDSLISQLERVKLALVSGISE
ncbi:MAG: hypothetical protein ACRDA8_18050, partial [Shewanella sp.]